MLGARPRSILTKVLSEGLVIASAGVVAGLVVGFALERTIGKYIGEVQLPGALPLIASAAVILAAAVIASALPGILGGLGRSGRGAAVRIRALSGQHSAFSPIKPAS